MMLHQERTHERASTFPEQDAVPDADNSSDIHQGRTSMGYSGKCFCGSVEIEATGEPEAMGYCHCSSCRSWSAGPVNAFTLWKTDAVKVKAGAEHIGTFEKTAFSQRMHCKKCGGHLMTGHNPVGLVDVYAATIPSLKFVP